MAAKVVFLGNQEPLLSVECETQLNLLAHAQLGELFIGSQCGGHGKCGKDQISIRPYPDQELSPITDAERKHLTLEQLENGIRLGCQVWPNRCEKGLLVNVLCLERRDSV